MRILLLRPMPSPETIGLQHVMIVEPLELELLGSLLPATDSAKIVDMILEREPVEHFIQRENPDVVCVTGYITNVPAMIHYCVVAKKINSKIATIVGGVHCEVCPEDLDHEAVDFRVVRNAVVAFPSLIDHIRGMATLPDGVLRPGTSCESGALPALDFSFPVPDRRLTSRYRSRYFYIFHDRVALIKTAFGCPYKCSFCFCRAITSGAYHERPLEAVMQELGGIREKEIYIVDDDFLVSVSRVRAFIEKNRSAGMDNHYLIYGRSDFIAQNPRLMESFRDVGLKTVIVGIESFSDSELQTYNKQIDAATNVEALRVLRALDIDCYATVIVSPDWGKSEFAQCGKRLRELGVKYVNLQPLTPLPGTGMKLAVDDLVIPYSDYPKWDLAHVTIRPRKMSIRGFYRQLLALYKAIVLRPRVLLEHCRNHSPRMLWKMLKGSFLVHRQYVRKVREADIHA